MKTNSFLGASAAVALNEINSKFSSTRKSLLKLALISSLGIAGISNAQAQWQLNGNSDTQPATNFLGTNNDADVIFKRAGQEVFSFRRAIIPGPNTPYDYPYFNKAVRIGSNTLPQEWLHLNGHFRIDAGSLKFYTSTTSTTLGQISFNGTSFIINRPLSMGGNNITTTGKVEIGLRKITSGSHTDYKLSVDGKVVAGSVVVTSLGWADYVFDKNYKLKPLSEVESFIKENKHLPEVPSEKEVMEKGISLGDMDAVLLKKIEELTLYMIEMKKENKALSEKLEKLSK